MSDPKQRLLEDGSPFERLLLQSSESEEPPAELEKKILAAMMVAPSAGLADEAAESSQVRQVYKPARSRLVRPMAVATIALGLLFGGALTVSRAPSPEPAPSSGVDLSGPPADPVPSIAERPAELPTVTPDSLPTARDSVPAAPAQQPIPAARPRGTATSQSMTAEPSSSLEREIALLDSVKAKLGAGAASDAARALDTYDTEFPQGTLRPEATVLRIRTLLLQGRRAEAQKLGDDFLTKHPGSVHAKRIRALLAS